MDLNFRIQYKKGVHNGAADALSRCPAQDLGPVMAIFECIPSWVQKLQEGYKDDSDTKQLLTEFSVNGSNDKGYTL